MAFWISKFIHTTWHHQSKWHITHNKIYFVCMGMFCLLYMMTKRYHKSYTCMCACMWSFVCLCVQLARSETKVKGLLVALHCTFETVCLWTRSSPIWLLSGWRLQACYHTRLIHCLVLRSGFRPSWTRLIHWDIPQPKLHTFGKTFYVVITRNHNSQLEPCWPTSMSSETVSENVHRKN